MNGLWSLPVAIVITTRHPASQYGVPVVIVDGEVLDQPAGLRAVLDALGWNNEDLATNCNYSERTVEDWLQGRRKVPAEALNVLADALADAAE